MLLHAWVPGVSETTIRTAGQSSFYLEFAVLKATELDRPDHGFIPYGE